jgi:hypothetical protein|tara:strand:+ start:20826 stop:21020 length:195 start_codon:yes stop_codon:yes gene_type:complete
MSLFTSFRSKLASIFSKLEPPVQVEKPPIEMSFPVTITGVQVKKEVAVEVLSEKMKNFLTGSKD